ncbi:MAG: class I SAM-dependent methyltransferase, partial [Thermoleophilia bacterium]
VSFLAADLRELDFAEEFDLVLNLNDGAIGYFETEEENHRTFEVIASALRPGGGNLLQLPNVLYAEAHLPQKTWIAGEGMVELIDHRWDARTRYLEGSTMPILVGETFEGVSPIPFRQRLYSLEELTEIYASVGMEFAGAFPGTGKPRPPKDSQFEVFFAGRKPS